MAVENSDGDSTDVHRRIAGSPWRAGRYHVEADVEPCLALPSNSQTHNNIGWQWRSPVYISYARHVGGIVYHVHRGGATPGRARSKYLAGRSTALAPPCLLLCFGNGV